MASAQIQALLGPPKVEDANKRTLLFLNERFKTFEDLEETEDFDELVEQARARSQDLKSKLSQSQASVDALVASTRTSAQEHLHTAQELSLLRHSLTDELSFLSEELVSKFDGPKDKPTLLEDIETLHRNLKELESVKGYVQVIAHGLKLSEASTVKARGSSAPFDSITEYEQLQKFVSSVSSACSVVEDAAGAQKPHVVTFLENLRDQTWSDIKNSFTTYLLSTAEKIGWPMPVDYVKASQEDRKGFETAFANLLKLQSIGGKLHSSLNKERTEKDGLYPIQALVQPVALRFKYHFEGTRQTNRLDKPEWYFTHVLNASHEHRSFMESIIQALLVNTEFKHIVAWREFTLLLLPMLSRKLRKTVPQLVAHPSILAHTIYQALSFDSALREEGFGLGGTSADKKLESDDESREGWDRWEGVSEFILGRKEWFDVWVEGERTFAMDQYMEIISAPDAWHIADDSTEEDEGETFADRELRPTNSARRVKALVEQVTDRYSPLPQFTHRTRFLISVQLPLLEQYHARISASLDAFETLSSTFLRAVPGALSGDGHGGSSTDPKRLTSGVDGVGRLGKALVSARYLSAAMEAWGEDLFFLELWTEINHKASLRSRAEATSSLPDPKGANQEVPEGTIFEELVTQYNKLVERAEEMIVQAVCSEVEGGLKAHYAVGGSTQTTPLQTSILESDDIPLPPTLLPPIALLSSHLTALASTQPPTTTFTLYRKIASRLAQYILQRSIFYRGHARITPKEGRTVRAEGEVWVQTCKAALAKAGTGAAAGGGRAEAPWREFLTASRVVGAIGEEWERVRSATLGMKSDEEWEDTMLDVVGFAELGRQEVGEVIRMRIDSDD